MPTLTDVSTTSYWKSNAAYSAMTTMLSAVVAMSPESICIEPAGWPPAFWFIERTIVNLSAIFAFIGSSSVSCMPGTLVEIVLKGPRYSLPMSGFGS